MASSMMTKGAKRSRSPSTGGGKGEEKKDAVKVENYKQIKDRLEKHFGRPLRVTFSYQIETDFETGINDDVAHRADIPDDTSQLLLRVDESDGKTKFAICMCTFSQGKSIRAAENDQNRERDILFETLDRHWRAAHPILSTLRDNLKLGEIKNFTLRIGGNSCFAEDFLNLHLDGTKSTKHKYEDFTVEYPIALTRCDRSLTQTILEVCTTDQTKSYCTWMYDKLHWIDIKDKDYVFIRTRTFDDKDFYSPVETLEVITPSKSVRILEQIKDDYLSKMTRSELLEFIFTLKHKDNLRVPAMGESRYSPPRLEEYRFDTDGDDDYDSYVQRCESRPGEKVRTPKSRPPPPPPRQVKKNRQ